MDTETYMDTPEFEKLFDEVLTGIAMGKEGEQDDAGQRVSEVFKRLKEVASPMVEGGAVPGPDDLQQALQKAVEYQAPQQSLSSMTQSTFSTEMEEDDYDPTVQPTALKPPTTLPKTHGIPVGVLHFRSYHVPLLDFFMHFVLHTGHAIGIPCSGVVHLPTQRTLQTVIRSPFIHKKSQENFERKTHKRCIKLWDANAAVVDRWIRYLQENMLPGVGMRVTRWNRVPLGIGKQMGEVPLEEPTAAEVQRLADAIVHRELAQTLRETATP